VLDRYNNMKKNGFTLLEVLVSATIVAVLTVIGVVSYSSVNKRSRDVKRKSDMEQLRSALEMYRSDNAGYPAANTVAFGNVSALEGTLVSKYTPAIPADPQSPDANYYYVATNYDLTTDKYYGYCLCGKLETLSPANTCVTADLPGQTFLNVSCNYGLKNP
jgi:general secretion pathway protein G